MNVKEEQICRLCLKVAESDFQIIDENARKMFKLLLLKVNLAISKDPIICKDCAEVAEKCFSFKKTCIYAEQLVISYAIDKKRAMFEMKNVYIDRKDVDPVYVNFTCRFCLNYFSDKNFVLLATLMKDVTFAEMLRRLMPAMDFDIVRNPIICTTCKQNMEYYAKFVQNCLDVEEKITKYLQKEGIFFSGQFRLSEIQHISLKNISELDDTQTRVIKQEVILEDMCEVHSEGYDGELIKTEEIDIKDEEVNFNESACEIPSDPTLYKLNIPGGSKLQIGSTQASLTQNSSFPPTIADYRMCTCGARHHCLKCDVKSNTISETGVGKAYQKRDKSEIDKKTNQMLSTENISEAHIFKCAMCTYETKHKSNLNRHMSVHKDSTEVKMHNCSMCTYETKDRYNLKKHMLIHKDIMEVEMYKCSMCTYQAKQKSNLKIHMLVHKDVREVEMYKCSICTFETKRKGSLKFHMSNHKDIKEVEMYKCAMCTFETKDKRHLKYHMVIHKDVTEVEMYKCSMCTFETKHKCSLSRHILTHNDIRAVQIYKCSVCTFETKQKGNLKNHMLRRHKHSSMCAFETKDEGNLKSMG